MDQHTHTNQKSPVKIASQVQNPAALVSTHNPKHPAAEVPQNDTNQLKPNILAFQENKFATFQTFHG